MLSEYSLFVQDLFLAGWLEEGALVYPANMHTRK